MRVNKIDQCQSLYLVSVLLSIVYEITSAFHYKNNKEELWKDMSRKFNIFQAPSILVHSRLIHSADLDLPFSGGRVFRTNGKKKTTHHQFVVCTCALHMQSTPWMSRDCCTRKHPKLRNRNHRKKWNRNQRKPETVINDHQKKAERVLIFTN